MTDTDSGLDSKEGLVVEDLRVEYDGFVLGPLRIELPEAQALCLLGPNGSGKTTLIHASLGLRQPDQGGARWRGENLSQRPPAVFAEIGYVGDSREAVIPEFSPQEYWEYCALAYAREGRATKPMLERAAALAKALDFTPPNRSINSLSLGMCRKTQLVAGLMHEPALLVLDEPLIGLDFLSIRALEAVLTDERERGAAIWLSSHDLGLAERLADLVAVLHLGRLLAQGPVDLVRRGQSLQDRVEELLRSARRGAEA